MINLLYEQDLKSMKYTILTSSKHKETIKVLAEHLGIPPQRIRKVMIQRLDMMALEACAVRYETWSQVGDSDSSLKRAIGYELYTQFIPLIPTDEMEKVYRKAEAFLISNPSMEEAAAYALLLIREDLLK